MKFVTGKTTKAISYQTIAEGGLNNQSVTVHGAVHALRDMGGITFLTLRMADGAIQCVCNPQVLSDGLCEECTVELSGLVRSESRAPGGWEIGVEKITVLSSPAAPMPVSLAKRKLDIRLDAELPLRPVVLRDLRRRAVFKLQEGLAQAFRDYLTREGFTEIHTPKIVSAGAEGGSNLFRLDYFGKKACLAQSPQIYKQTMVGAYERVFEVGPVFRAEKHATPRHLNEYTGLDLEMGYIRSFYDIMEVEVGFLAHAMNLLKTQYHRELALMDVKLPDASRIPCLRFDLPSGWRRKNTDIPSGTLTTWNRRRKPTLVSTSERSWAATLCLLPTTRPRSGPSTLWTIRKIQRIPCPSTCCSGGWR